jgi:hypothetical protein
MGARARIIIAAVVAIFAASVAMAQTGCSTCSTGTLYQSKAPTSGSLGIYVSASVGGRCGFATAPSGTHDEPNFDNHTWTHDFTFVLDCTGPSRVAVVSQNGGLLTAGAVPAGYATLAPYNVELNLVRNAGLPANQTCTAANLKVGGSCTFIGPSSTTQGLYLASTSTLQSGSYLRVGAPTYGGANILASGNYADVLLVTVSAAP